MNMGCWRSWIPTLAAKTKTRDPGGTPMGHPAFMVSHPNIFTGSSVNLHIRKRKRAVAFAPPSVEAGWGAILSTGFCGGGCFCLASARGFDHLVALRAELEEGL